MSALKEITKLHIAPELDGIIRAKVEDVVTASFRVDKGASTEHSIANAEQVLITYVRQQVQLAYSIGRKHGS